MPERVPASTSYLQGHWTALSTLLRETPCPRDLTEVEQAAILPTRHPSGDPQNQARGKIVRALNDAGFTVAGKRCT